MRQLTFSVVAALYWINKLPTSYSFQVSNPYVLGSSRSSKKTNSLIIISSSSSDNNNNNEQQRQQIQYPLSTRQALLINKAKDIDPSLDSIETTNKKGSYSTVGWSNRLGTVLTPASIPGVYTADRPFYWNNIDVGCRMTVIEIPTSSTGSANNNENNNNKNKPDLWIHSPVSLDGPLKDAIDKLGTVKHIVSPNYEHVKFAKMWADTYPDANVWGCPGLVEREPTTRWTGELPYDIRPYDFDDDDDDAVGKTSLPPQMWDINNVIQAIHINCEVNPFTNKPFFNEVIFYHIPSKTLLTTDLYWNYPGSDGITNSNYNNELSKEDDYGVWDLAPSVSSIPIGSRLWKVGMDKLFQPFYMNLMIKKGEKRDDFNKICKYILGEGEGSSKEEGRGWDVETIIPAHGDIVRGKKLIQSILRKHFNLS